MATLNKAFDTEAQYAEELLIVDGDVKDVDILLTGLARPMDVIHLEFGLDPMGQIARALTSRFGTKKLHILAHGKPGALALAGVQVDTAYLAACRDALNTIKFALAQPSSMSLWSCSVAAGDMGKGFISALGAYTGADVFAAKQPVGAAERDGTWSIGAASPFVKSAEAAYPHILGPNAGTLSFSNNLGDLVSEMQDPVALNFDNSGLDFVVNTTGGDGASISITAASAFGHAADNGSDITLQTKVGVNTTVDDYRLVSTDGTEFQLESLQLGTLVTYSNSPISYTITGWRDGIQVATLSFSSSENTVSTSIDGWATVNFGSEWENIDEVRFVGTNPDTFAMSLDDIVILAASDAAPELGGTPLDDTATEDVATAIDLSAYDVSDAEEDTITLTLAVDRGTLASTDGNSTTDGVTIANSGTASMTLQGTAANLNAYLNDTMKITFTTDANDTTTATLTVTPNDGTADGTADTVSITIDAVNDAATVFGGVTGAIGEDDDTLGGTATVTDVDNPDDTFADDTVSGTYGDLTIAANGDWLYDLDEATGDVQALNAGDTLGDTIAIQSDDGTSQNVTITINGANDTAGSFGGDLMGSVTEESTLATSGTATVSDVDNNDDSFTADTISGTYGELVINSSGGWTYTLDNANNDVQALNDDDTLSDTIAVQSEDGSSQDIIITINGTDENTPAVISGDTTSSATEDHADETGTLIISDVDGASEEAFTADTISGSFGDLTIQANGDWSYAVDDSNSNVDALNIGDTLVDTITVQSVDGTEQNITITISGANDGANSFGGDLTGSLSEDDTVDAAGTASVVDVDNNDDSFTADTISGTFGDLTIDAAGNWSYDLDETNSSVQALAGGDTLEDIVSIQSVDGSAQSITITINGVNDLSSSSNGSVSTTEDTAYTFDASDFNFSDVDAGDSFASVRIDTLPSEGQLLLSGTPVSVGDQISASDIAANNLRFVPDANENGSTYASFTFTVNDGDDYAASSSDIIVSVSARNDSPTDIRLSGSSVHENAVGVAVGTLSATDIDSNKFSYSVDDERFMIDGSTLMLAPGISFDFEEAESVFVAVTVKDSEGASRTEIFTIDVNDVNEVMGANSDETIEGSDQRDDIDSGAGHDLIETGDGQDTIKGGAGDDRADGGNDDDLIFGGDGNDTMEGGLGQDTLRGGEGRDEVVAGGGNDLVFAGQGDEGADIVSGGDGDDTLGGGHGGDSIDGGTGNDLIWGVDGDDTLIGGSGSDIIFNGLGSDVVFGGEGDDRLWSSAGDDTLSGGAGTDTFVFGRFIGADQITDFDVVEDVLDFTFAQNTFTSSSDVEAAASAVNIDGVNGVLIDMGDGDSIFLASVSESELASLNYIF